jgi:hypothetical protein
MLEEFDDTGGLDTSRFAGSNGIMTGTVTAMGLYSGLIVDTTLDPREQPFLYDHQIGGTPVLPGVMGIEALVEAAGLLFPDRYVGAIEDVDFAVPFKFYRGEPRTVRARAFFRLDGDDVVADCRLEGSRTLHGQSEPEVTTHFRARVRLVVRPPVADTHRDIVRNPVQRPVAKEDIYKVFFHGPAYRVVENSWRDGEGLVGLYAGDLPDNHAPAERRTVAEPRWLELCFQTAGIMELAGTEKMGLPHHVGAVRILHPSDQARGRVVAAVTSTGGAFDAAVVDESGEVMMTVEGYRTMAMPDTVSGDLLRPLKEAMDRP